MKRRRIRSRFFKGGHELTGWFDGKHSYVWIGKTDGGPYFTMHGRRLLRLAKAIVAHMEESDGQ